MERNDKLAFDALTMLAYLSGQGYDALPTEFLTQASDLFHEIVARQATDRLQRQLHSRQRARERWRERKKIA
ncbi:MAG: hypothetical protein V2G41_09235 [bacterium JZ-2024 1]